MAGLVPAISTTDALSGIEIPGESRGCCLGVYQETATEGRLWPWMTALLWESSAGALKP
jgi:hypothetical protein